MLSFFLSGKCFVLLFFFVNLPLPTLVYFYPLDLFVFLSKRSTINSYSNSLLINSSFYLEEGKPFPKTKVDRKETFQVPLKTSHVQQIFVYCNVPLKVH